MILNSLKQLFEEIVISKDTLSLVTQLLLLFLYTLFLVYPTALFTRRFTLIVSHTWIILDSAVSSFLAWLFYWLLCLTLDANVWLIIVLGLVWAGFLQFFIGIIDRGRSLIDLDPERTAFLHTDFRLITKATALGLVVMIYQ